MGSTEDLTHADAWAEASRKLREQQLAPQVANNVYAATSVNPDAAAKANVAARFLGIPAESAAAFPEDTARQVRMQQFDASRVVTRSPVLARFLTVPSTANAIHDDLDNAGAIEQAVRGRQYMSPSDTPDAGPTMRERLSDWWRGIFGAPSVAQERQQRQAAQATAILASRQPGMSNDQAWEQSRQAVGGMSQIPQMVAERFIDSATFGLAAPTDPVQPHSWQASTAGATGQLAGFIAGPAKAAGALINPLERVAGESFIKGFSKSTINEAATLALASAAEKAGHATLDTTSFDQAAKMEADALTSGAETGAIFGAAKKLLPDTTIPQWIARAIGVSAAQDAADGTSPWDERVPLEDRLFKYFLNTAFTLHGGGRSEGGFFRDVATAKIAEQNFGELSALSKLATESKWRERDPESFRKFVADSSENGDLANVYVDARTFAQSLDKAGVRTDELVAMLPEVAGQMKLALETNGTVRIPTPDYLTKVAGGPLDAELLQHLRTDPAGATYAEARQFLQQHADAMRAASSDLAADNHRIESAQTSQRVVRDRIQAQLDALGRFPSDVNKVHAAITTAVLSQFAAHEGITPEQAFEKYGARVVAQTPAGALLDQFVPLGQGLVSLKDNPNFAEWFGDSKAVEASGEPKVVYHGTSADFDVFDRAKAGGNTGAANTKLGFFFTDRPDVAGNYAGRGEGASVMPAYLSLKNPLRLTAPNMREADKLLMEKLGAEHDGAVLEVGEGDRKQTVYMVREQNQVKSATGNDGSYDPSNPSILHQDDAAKAEVTRGSFNPQTNTITLLKTADLSTYLHETGHWILDTYMKVAARADAPAAIKADAHHLLRWFGVESLDKWHGMSLDEQRPHHEKLARGFETYLMEGKAPSQELQPFFARIRAWMVSIYRELRALNAPLTEEVRGVFDRMLASDEAIRAAQAARVFEPLFKEKPAGMTAEEWAAYQDLGAQATNEAVEQMQAKSLRDMRWLSGAKSKALKDVQRQADAARQEVRADVEKEVDQEPVYRAESALKEKGGPKISIAGLEDLYMGEGDRYALLDWKPLVDERLASKEGEDPELFAERFGFRSADEMVRALLSREPRDQVIEGLTDRYMLERHGELATPDAVERAANEAVHNEVRARFMATGLKVLTAAPVSARELVRGADEAAQAAIARIRVGDLNPGQYLAAETKANREALKLAPKDPAAAAQAQRAALLNNRLVAEAYKAQDLVRQALKYAKSFDKISKRLKIDPEDRDLIDSLLQRFDFRQVPPEGPSSKQVQLQQWVDSQKALGYTPTEVPDMLNEAVRVHYKDMSIEQLRGLMDTIRSIEKIGRERRTVTVEGQRLDVEAAVLPIIEKLKERGEKFTDRQLAEGVRLGVDPLWRVTLDRLGAVLRGGLSEFLRPDYKANRYDLHELLGPFQRAVSERLIGAAYRFGDYMDQVAKLKRDRMAEYGLDAEWQKSLNTVVANHDLLDNSLETPARRRLTRGDLIGIAMHVGNESNFDKLTRGMQWRPEAVWRALHENMGEKDWLAAKLMGELAGLHWEEMAAMNRRLGNDNPEKIEPRPFQTRYGEMPGWYAPIAYDPIRSRLGAKKADAKGVNPQDGLFGRDYFRADTTTNGSLNARMTGYQDFIDLDWRPIEKRISDAVRDLSYREALIDVHKVYSNKALRQQFMRTYGREEYEHLGDWLGRLVNSEVGDERQSKLTAIASASRRALVANGVAFRISTMLKHGGSAGAKSAGYFAGGGEKHFAARVAQMSTNYGNQVTEALAKFPEIRQRLRQQDRDFSRAVASIFEPESIHGKAERFGHAGVAWLDFLTAVPTAHAAYDWAITEGIPKRLGGTGKPMSEADAIKFASKIVREAHGSTNEASQSLLITNRSEIVKMLTTLHGFMNNAFGQSIDAADKLLHAQGFGKPELLARVLMAQVVPAVMAGWVTFGGPNERESWLGWAFHHIGGEFAGMLPMVREGWQVVVEGRSSAGLPAWMRALGDTYKAGKSVVKGAEGEPVKHPIKDAGNAVGLLLPGAGQLGATSQLLYDVAKGEQRPETVGEWIRGVMSGDSRER